MRLSELLSKLEDYRAGTFVKIEWEREISSAKAKKLGHYITKHSEGVFRVDIDYKNLSSVQMPSRDEIKESWFQHSTLHDAIVENKKDPSKKYLQVFFGSK